MAIVTGSSTESITVTRGAGTLEYTQSGKHETKYTLQVTETDRDGYAAAVRVTLVEDRQHLSDSTPGRPDLDETIELSQIMYRADRRGLLYQADTKSVVSTEMAALTAPQIWALKRAMYEQMIFDVYPEGMALSCLPDRPVAVGESWDVTPDRLARSRGTISSSMGISNVSASGRFRLVSVKDGKGAIEGSACLVGVYGTVKVSSQIDIRASMDTASGRWERVSRVASDSFADARRKQETRDDSEYVCGFTPGDGCVPPIPAGAVQLGWVSAGKDNNSYKEPNARISLDVPEGYTPRPGYPKPGILAAFVGIDGSHLVISKARRRLPQDLSAAVLPLTERLERAGMVVVRQEAVALANGVPGQLLTAKSQTNATRGRSYLVALDGNRVVLVMAIPASPQACEQLRRAMMSLRMLPYQPRYMDQFLGDADPVPSSRPSDSSD